MQLAGGRPGRLDPLPSLLAAGPFRYVEAPGDDSEILTFLDQSGRCPTRMPLEKWRIWMCNGAASRPLARFDEGIRLEMAQIPDRLPADGCLPVTLFWSAERPVAKDHTVFVHIVGRDGQMVGQWDQVPAAGTAPTSGWTPGQLIADEYHIPLQAGASAARIKSTWGCMNRPPVRGSMSPARIPSASGGCSSRQSRHDRKISLHMIEHDHEVARQQTRVEICLANGGATSDCLPRRSGCDVAVAVEVRMPLRGTTSLRISSDWSRSTNKSTWVLPIRCAFRSSASVMAQPCSATIRRWRFI